MDTVDEGYFATMGVPILRGRGFLASDTADAPRVAVVNEQFAKHCWPGVLGQRHIHEIRRPIEGQAIFDGLGHAHDLNRRAGTARSFTGLTNPSGSPVDRRSRAIPATGMLDTRTFTGTPPRTARGLGSTW